MDAARMNYFNFRRVTRDQLSEHRSLINSDDNLTEPNLLYPGMEISTDEVKRSKYKHLLQGLLDAGKNVCRIDIDGVAEGTGFHLGAGWVMTNQHVICANDEEAGDAHRTTFHFPTQAIPAQPRKVLFSYFQDAPAAPGGAVMAFEDSKTDLALVYLD